MAAHDALRTILPVAGLSEERARTVEITGGSDPVLPTPFHIGETSAAAVAATGLAAADLWELRTGRRQEVGVDLRHATETPTTMTAEAQTPAITRRRVWLATAGRCGTGAGSDTATAASLPAVLSTGYTKRYPVLA